MLPKLTTVTLALLVACCAGRASQAPAPEPPQTAAPEPASAPIELTQPEPAAPSPPPGPDGRACKAHSDCVIKGVGSCCGPVPTCMNVNAEIKPFTCPPGVVGVCGYPSIDGCECFAGRCEGVNRSEGS